jgi:hypothetical protein
MSHKTNVEVTVDDKDCLIAALEEMGYTVGGKKTLKAFDWKINADVTISKNGKDINLGFIEKEDGTFKLEADFYGTSINQKNFQEQVNTLHGKHKVTKWFTENRYQTSLETDEEGNMVVVGTKWS